MDPSVMSEPADRTTTEREAIDAAARDYFEGWFDGDVERMERALHPALAKRALTDDRWTLNETTTEWMLDATAKHLGKSRDLPDREIVVDVVDAYGDVATVVVRSAIYREYVHLVRTRDGWKIVNALWTWT